MTNTENNKPNHHIISSKSARTQKRNDTSAAGSHQQQSAIVLTFGPEVISSLHIKTVRPKDAGTYTCAPSNARNYSVVVHVIKGIDIFSFY